MNSFIKIKGWAFVLLALVLSQSPLSARKTATDLSRIDKPATLKVLLVHGAPSVFVEAKGKYSVFNLAGDLLLDSGIFGKKGDISSSEGWLKWGGHLPKISAIRLVPGDSQSTFLVDGVEYKGCLDIRSLGDSITVINEIDVESYLSAMLSLKFEEPLTSEVAEALAIVARTNALYFIKTATSALWHVKASHVGYHGYGFCFQKPFIDRAIEKTRHIVMTYDGAPFPAFWTENSAGKTTHFSAVFRKEALVPPGVSVPIAEHERDQHKWATQVSKEKLSHLCNTGAITGIDLFCDEESAKVYAVRLKTGGEKKDIPFHKFQRLVGDKILPSNDFTVSSKNNALYFTGYGKGLGMGLCLLSAKKMADQGKKAPEMLAAFFPGVQIVPQHSLR